MRVTAHPAICFIGGQVVGLRGLLKLIIMKALLRLSAALLPVFLLLLVACEPEKKTDEGKAPAADTTKADTAHAAHHADAAKTDGKHDAKKTTPAKPEHKDAHVADATPAKPKTNVVDKDPDPDPSELIQVEFEPVPKNLDKVNGAIVYPEACKKEGVKGTVYLKVLINKQGYYVKHIVRESPDKRLTDAVVAQAKKLQYTPARKNGQPVKLWMAYEYEFK